MRAHIPGGIIIKEAFHQRMPLEGNLGLRGEMGTSLVVQVAKTLEFSVPGPRFDPSRELDPHATTSRPRAAK